MFCLFIIIFLDQIPKGIAWIQYLSFNKYAYEALAINELSSIIIVDTIGGAQVTVSFTIKIYFEY